MLQCWENSTLKCHLFSTQESWLQSGNPLAVISVKLIPKRVACFQLQNYFHLKRSPKHPILFLTNSPTEESRNVQTSKTFYLYDRQLRNASMTTEKKQSTQIHCCDFHVLGYLDKISSLCFLYEEKLQD
jgi:hypothetical protein